MLALTGLTLTAFAGTLNTNIIWQTKGDGRSAEVQFGNSRGNNNVDNAAGGRVNLLQMNGSTNTFMFYEIWGYDLTSQGCTTHTDDFGNVITICVFTRFNYSYGWGLIPNSDFQITSTNASLETETGANFARFRCTTDSSTTNVVTTCGPGGGGVFDLTWQPNNFSTNTVIGANQNAFGPFSFTSTGTSVARSAYVTGNAIGHSMENAPGRLGDTKGKNVATVTP